MGTKTFSAKVWQYPGMAGWYFVSLPKKLSVDLKKKYGQHQRGWGSLPVKITLGKTTWKTSIFPDRKAGTYLLPLKAAIRKKETVSMGETRRFTLELASPRVLSS